MSKAGQNTFKGINTQAKASLLLFLLNLKNYDFDSLTLEDKNWEDFTLNFRSGKKIICESKDWSRTLSWVDIKNILVNILNRETPFNQTDEVIIVCNSVIAELEKNIEHIKYGFPGITKLYKKNGFTDKQIKLLGKTSFFKVESDEFLYQEALIYFYDQFPYWVPQKELEMLMDSLLIHEIYWKSEKGLTFTKSELVDKIEDYKRNKIKSSHAYDPERKSMEEQLKTQLAGLHDPTYRALILSSDALIAQTAQPNLMFFLLDQIKKVKSVDLTKMDELWQALTKRLYAFNMLRIFEENIDNKDNASYILEFVAKNYNSLSSPIRDNFNQECAIETMAKILDRYPDLVNNVFRFIKTVLDIRGDEYKEIDTRRDIERERDLLSELLQKVYVYYQQSNNKEKQDEIIDLIKSHFNLVDDDGQFVMFTPNSIFGILLEYVNFDFEKNFIKVLKLILDQYQSSQRYNGKFDGWDWSGGGISQSGSGFSISDRHFVSILLKQALNKYYKVDRDRTWEFIIKNFIARKTNNVSADKPDFLNRASIPILFAEYKNSKHGPEAFNILSNFVKMRKGIPWKADLIFQELNGDYTKEQKWALVKISLDEYHNLPINVFVEQITSDLAAGGNKEAADIIASWVMNPEYHRRQTIGSFNVMGNIAKLLDNPETFGEGVKIFRNYIKSDEFVKKDDDWETWEVAKNLAKIIVKDLNIGVNILKEVNSSKTLTLNQQILICSSINDLPKENKEVLHGVYNDFVYPFLQDFDNDISKIEKRITNRHSREQIVQFAEKLAENRLYDEALYIIKIFINDSDPILENYPDDPKGDFNYHRKIIEGDDNPTIGTVRGFCAWALQKFCIRYGRDHIPTILPLVEQLTKDPNYYVRMQACIPLLELVKNRHTVLSENNKERFLPMEVAEHIEEIAFAMLTDKENHKVKAVMKHLAMVFTYMRTLDEKQAMIVLETFKNTGFESVMDEAAPLYIFFAEFRSKSFKDWPWSDITKFDDKPFKALLKDLLKNGSPEIKSVLSWQFNRLPDEISKTPKEKSQITVDEAVALAVFYFEILTGKYEHRVFENIYRFIEDYIDSHFEDCFTLWTKCLERERPFLTEAAKDKENVPNVYWWPFFYNGKILLAVAKHKGSTEYLKWFEFLANYPIEVLIANDLADAIGPLKKLPKDNKQVARIFDKLIERNANFLDDKQEWSKNETL